MVGVAALSWQPYLCFITQLLFAAVWGSSHSLHSCAHFPVDCERTSGDAAQRYSSYSQYMAGSEAKRALPNEKKLFPVQRQSFLPHVGSNL